MHVNFTLERAITLLLLEHRGKIGVAGQRNVPAALPLGKTLSIHCIRGWVGPTASLKGCGKLPHPGFDHRTESPNPTLRAGWLSCSCSPPLATAVHVPLLPRTGRGASLCTLFETAVVECVWNLMAHVDAREGKWKGNWRMEWVASTLTLHRNVVYPALLTLMRTPRLPAVDWNGRPRRFKWTRPFRRKTKFLRVCHQVSNALYQQMSGAVDRPAEREERLQCRRVCDGECGREAFTESAATSRASSSIREVEVLMSSPDEVKRATQGEGMTVASWATSSRRTSTCVANSAWMFGGRRFVHKVRRKSDGTDGPATVRRWRRNWVGLRCTHQLLHQKLADALLLGEWHTSYQFCFNSDRTACGGGGGLVIASPTTAAYLLSSCEMT